MLFSTKAAGPLEKGEAVVERMVILRRTFFTFSYVFFGRILFIFEGCVMRKGEDSGGVGNIFLGI